MTDFRALCAEQAENVRYLLDCVADGDSDPVAIAECVQHLGFTRAALDEPEGGTSVEQVAQIVYENAMLATANTMLATSPDHAKPHWPSWADLPNSDARTHALNTAEIILARWGRPFTIADRP
jgi:hypothetical protein